MRHVVRLLCVLIGFGSLIGLASLGTGCARAPAVPVLPPAPVVRVLPDCPAPARPVLPLLDGALPFDAPLNMDVLLRRDDLIRQYLKGLEASVFCYQRPKGAPDAH